MSLILNIHTALPNASISLGSDDGLLSILENGEQKDHAGWLHPAIKELLEKNGYSPKDLDAVAVTIGPGSYTGLRIGLASAKGLCYALEKPLIGINTLSFLAFAVQEEEADLIIPMIDARRMEVFTAVYDKEIREKISTHALVLEPRIFSDLLDSNKIIFTGDGSIKFKPMLQHPNACFSNTVANAGHLSSFSLKNYVKKQFVDLAYAEPLYVKEFHTLIAKR